MHPNPAFRPDDRTRNLAFARDRAFGLLTANGPDGPLASHVPFALDEAGAQAGMHLVRSTPLARALRDGPVPALLAVSGPDGYLSPDWYGVADQVPTWNYVAVHLRGTLELRPEAEMRTLLDAQSAAFEARLAPKRPWTMDKMPEALVHKLMRQIVPCRLTVASVEGTWKLSQNKPDGVRLRAADAAAASTFGMELDALAALMRAGQA
ncbi:FMN-binding negative transcriptional regulator [Wenxinia marina]|uniref:Negative transcriptional regulator, PaiB family n=1 Tax=Wenxinia marina DSM 24838 TaxID=1123501 RepID=A0A0D0QJH8_9RHOB|nr:FMN-binding negative transcriptional regulator [Wenxinia marina]KIQ71168.1 negative transcriptional regulator, PaiB family [Wenxinia marina DSM 24838]GGL54295.1 hypothetical protein GCM10011392_05910 [Wenxinia marina]